MTGSGNEVECLQSVQSYVEVWAELNFNEFTQFSKTKLLC